MAETTTAQERDAYWQSVGAELARQGFSVVVNGRRYEPEPDDA
jgi:hypothetical protein